MLENIFDVLSLPSQLSPLPGASHTRGTPLLADYIFSHVKITSFWKTQTLSKSRQTKFKTRFRPLESFYSTTGRFLFFPKRWKNFGQIGRFLTIFERFLEVFLGLHMY